MAEFWVLDWTYRHYMDDWTPDRIAEETVKNPDFPRKYAARFQAGDITQVNPDGSLPAGRVIAPSRRDVCIKIPSIPYETAKQYMEPYLEAEIDKRIPQRILKRFRYRVDWSRISQAVKDQLAVTRVYTLSNITQLRIVNKVT